MMDSAKPASTAQALTDHGKIICAKIRKDLDADTLSIPLLPDVARQVIELINDPDSNASQLAKLIQSDQALAGHVMRVANSAAYSPTASLVSLQQAIARLGMGMIGDICLSISTGTKLFKVPGFEQYIQQLWRQAVLTALWSKEISRCIRRNVESAFLCGLLHSIGKPVTLQLCLDQAKRMEYEIDAREVHQIVAELHQDVGVSLLQRWQLPAIIVEAIQYFADYAQAPNYHDLAATITAAAFIADHHDSGNQDEDTMAQCAALAAINFYRDEIAGLLDKREQVSLALESLCH